MIKQLQFGDKFARVDVFNQNEHLQKHWVKGQFYESHRSGLLNWAYTNIPKQGIYIDCGASIGNHSLFMAIVMQAKDVYSFEPDPQHFGRLKYNIELNKLKNVELFNLALSNEAGEGVIHYHDKLRHQTGGMMSGELKIVKPESGTARPAKISTLDETFPATCDKITWMKMDCEGSEANVLSGAKRMLTDGKIEYISAECRTPDELKGVSEILAQYDYKMIAKDLNHTPTYVWKR